MDYFRVKNWEKFQHYKKRNPPWIKLYTSLLDDYEFGCLHDASKLLALCLLMLAAKCNNKLPVDATWLKKKLGLDQEIDLEPLFSHGFIVLLTASELLALCKQVATPETEQRRGETETNRDRLGTVKRFCGEPGDGRHTTAQAARIAGTKT